MTSAYGDCSNTCDGRQSRIVYCQCTVTDGSASGVSAVNSSAMDDFSIDASDADCERDDPRLRPVSTRLCGEECANYTWFEGPWGLCDKVCAPGNQTRTVYCKKQTATSENSTDDSDCEAIGPKPATELDCDLIVSMSLVDGVIVARAAVEEYKSVL